MNKTKIEWTDYSWNPITGCKHGCWYCYAKKLAQRFKKVFPYGFEPHFYPERLKEPWELEKPSKIFVCSIADLFAPWTSEEWRFQVIQSIYDCPVEHIFQLLTKNPERVNYSFKNYANHVWVGATVTEQSEADKIEDIKEVVCEVPFASFEPLLGDISWYMKGLKWAIIGKLTGSKKVKLKAEWVYNLLGQLKAHNIPVFMKNNLVPTIPKEKLIQEFPRVGGVKTQ
jgi:protein gp37